MSSLLHGYHHMFCVASGTPTASIFIRALKCSEYWHSITFLRVQLRLCHSCEYRILDLRKRPSSRYHLAPVRLYHQNAIPKPPQSTGNESHANLPRSPDRIIWPHVWHWTGWHLCWHLNQRWENQTFIIHPIHLQFVQECSLNVMDNILGVEYLARSFTLRHVHRTYPQPLKHNQYLYSVQKSNDCREGMWTLHLSIFLFSHESDHEPSPNDSQNLLISAAGLDTGISDGESTGAEESGAIAEECWPVP